jgi:hypothetical protein
MADEGQSDIDDERSIVDLGLSPPDELATRRAAKRPKPIRLPAAPELAELITGWIRANIPTGPSEVEAAGLVCTLLEVATKEWARSAPVDHVGRIPMTEATLVTMATAIYRGRNRLRLELRNEGTGLRHYLDGEPVNCGDPLQVRTRDGSWTTGRYIWNARERELPKLHSAEGICDLIADADVRRPR